MGKRPPIKTTQCTDIVVAGHLVQLGVGDRVIAPAGSQCGRCIIEDDVKIYGVPALPADATLPTAAKASAKKRPNK